MKKEPSQVTCAVDPFSCVKSHLKKGSLLCRPFRGIDAIIQWSRIGRLGHLRLQVGSLSLEVFVDHGGGESVCCACPDLSRMSQEMERYRINLCTSLL
jgi:hypothetical protein